MIFKPSDALVQRFADYHSASSGKRLDATSTHTPHGDVINKRFVRISIRERTIRRIATIAYRCAAEKNRGHALTANGTWSSDAGFYEFADLFNLRQDVLAEELIADLIIELKRHILKHHPIKAGNSGLSVAVRGKDLVLKVTDEGRFTLLGTPPPLPDRSVKVLTGKALEESSRKRRE